MHPYIQDKINGTIRTVAGIGIQLRNREEMHFSLVVLQRRDKSLEITHQKEGLASLADLKTQLPKGIPVVIQIDGWGVLVKKELEQNAALGGGTFNADEFETLFYAPPGSPNGYMAIIRKEILDHVLAEVGQLGHDAVGITIGPFSAIQLLSLFEKSGEYHLPQRLVSMENGQLVEIKGNGTSSGEPLSFGDETVRSALVSPYAAAATFFIGNFQGVDKSRHLWGEYLYKRLAFFTTAFSLGVILLGLVINFMLFDHYRHQLAEISSAFESNQALYKKLDNAQKELAKKEKLIENSGLESHTLFAYYADRLALLKPGAIQLDQMTFHPLEKKLQKGREAVFGKKTIFVSGKTSGSVMLNNWIDEIKKEKWVAGIEMVYFGREEEGNASRFNLQIRTQ